MNAVEGVQIFGGIGSGKTSGYIVQTVPINQAAKNTVRKY
jgi:hypothetical protein